MSLQATHAVALLRGFADDYARLLSSHGNQSTSAAITGIAKEASDAIILALRAKNLERVEAVEDPLPQTLAVEVK